MEVAARELESRVARIDIGRWRGPDRRLPCPVPADENGPCQGRIAQRIGMDTERVAGLGVRHPLRSEEVAQASRDVLRPPPARAAFGEPPEREDGPVPLRDDVRGEP